MVRSKINLKKRINKNNVHMYKQVNFTVKTTRKFREFLFLLSLLKKPYGFWVVLPTNQAFVEFIDFLSKSKINYKHIFMKSTFFKNISLFKKEILNTDKQAKTSIESLNNLVLQINNHKKWLPSGGSIYFSFSNLSCFFKAISYFFKENALKTFKHDLLSKFNIMSGSLISVKFLDFLMPSNLSFFEFFINSVNFMKINTLYFHFLFVKTTMVVLYSIMLIISLFKMMLMRFMSINLRLFFRFTSYANKKSID